MAQILATRFARPLLYMIRSSALSVTSLRVVLTLPMASPVMAAFRAFVATSSSEPLSQASQKTSRS